jgi:hypothetical protein
MAGKAEERVAERAALQSWELGSGQNPAVVENQESWTRKAGSPCVNLVNWK